MSAELLSPSTSTANTAVSVDELVKLCAINSELFGQTFFPRTFRQKSPQFHKEIDSVLDSDARYVNIQVFRDGAKTTKLRVYTAKRIAYGLAHTILYIGKSEAHALRSIKWIRKQVETNRRFADTFKLKPGSKWQDSEAEIIHGTLAQPIWILGMGITGSIRGINLDDFRPDLIVVDDAIDEENAATKEQRDKIEDLILGSLKNSLAPATESPDAKLVMLQTPLNREDASCKALKDATWTSRVFGCWTPETADLPLDKQVSAWEERYPSETYRAEKRSYIARNKLSLWNREKECKLTSVETRAFKTEWLKYYTEVPQGLRKVLAIDPVPPPSEIQIAKGLVTKDFEALGVVGKNLKTGDFYILEISSNRGHEPDWTIMEFFRLNTTWRPIRTVVEAIAYQRTLAWLLQQAMRVQKRYFVIRTNADKRSKYDRIVQSLNGLASQGKLHVHPSMVDFISQFTDYPSVSHDDELEVVAVACEELMGADMMEESEDEGAGEDLDTYLRNNERDIPALTYSGGAP
jgi:phage terminase large subunit-like protein